MVTGSHEKLERSLRSQEKRILAEMNKQLTVLQEHIRASTLRTIEQDRTTNVPKRAAAPDDFDGLKIKHVKPNTQQYRPAGADVFSRAETSNNINSSCNSGFSMRTFCYVNWNNKCNTMKYAKFVQYKELRTILEDIFKKDNYGGYSNVLVNLSPQDMIDARKRIRDLKELAINKYKRFPSTCFYVDVNLNSENNRELSIILTDSEINKFYQAACNYLAVIEENIFDQLLFENTFSLKWAPESTNLD